MKLLRYDPLWGEKQGLLDDSDTLQDLSTTLEDIKGDTIGPDKFEKIETFRP